MKRLDISYEDYTYLGRMIRLHEGFRRKPYVDTVGKLTVGYGRNLDDKGISEQEAAMLLENDIRECVNQLIDKIRFWSNLSPVRKMVLIDMCFNLGVGGLLTFRKFLEALEASDWLGAAGEMRKSKWWNQVGSRAERLQRMVLTNEYPKDLAN